MSCVKISRHRFDEILKFGAQIVDRLVAFQKPVFVYIPPLAELRGGAWVVVDPTINADIMEMYASDGARGGVLEPQGLVEIKFRAKDLKAMMHRLDETLQRLDLGIEEARRDADTGREAELRTQVDKREQQLGPVYTSVAVHFADLHDTPGRMRQTGVVRDVVPWHQARRYFYLRLKRRLLEFQRRDALVKASLGLLDNAAASQRLKAKFLEEDKNFDDDAKYMAFLGDDNIFKTILHATETDAIDKTVSDMASINPTALADALAKVSANPALRKALSQVVLGWASE